MPGNPFSILVGEQHTVTPNKTPVSPEAYNKIQDSLEGLLWALEHREVSVPRYLGDLDPDWTTSVGGDDHSGVDFSVGQQRSLAGRKFFHLLGGDTGGPAELKKLCKFNRPTTLNEATRQRVIIASNSASAVATPLNLAAADFQTLSSGLTLRGFKFTSSNATYRHLDLRGMYDTAAATTFDGTDYYVTLATGNVYNAHINPGDYVWIPSDTINKLVRVKEVMSSVQLKLADPVVVAAGLTVYVLRGPVTFENCEFHATVWVNNTLGVTFKNCVFKHDQGANNFSGGIISVGGTFPADDPGRCIGLRVQECLFLQLRASMTTRLGPVGAFKAMCLLDNCWAHAFTNNVWVRLAAAVGGADLGVLVTNGLGSAVFTGEGGVFSGNQEHNPTTLYTTAQRQTQITGTFKVYDDLNMHGANLL